MDSANLFKKFGNCIKELRLRKKPKITQEALAKYLGHHGTYINKVELGHRVLDIYDAEKAEKFLDAKVGELVKMAREISDRKRKAKVLFKERTQRVLRSGEVFEDVPRSTSKKIEIPVLNSVKSKSMKWDSASVIDRWITIGETDRRLNLGRHMYAIVVKDDSLNKKDGIDRDTVLIVDPSIKPREGNIVVLADGENYLIRIYSRNRSKIILKTDSTNGFENVTLTVKEFKYRLRGVAVLTQKPLIKRLTKKRPTK